MLQIGRVFRRATPVRSSRMLVLAGIPRTIGVAGRGPERTEPGPGVNRGRTLTA